MPAGWVGAVVRTASVGVMSTANNLQSDAFPPAWNAAVQHSRVLNTGYVAQAAQLFTGLSADQQGVVRQNLGELAALPSSAKGVAQALKLLGTQADAMPESPHAATMSGDPPGRAAMLSAGMCLIHGLVAQAAAAKDVKEATALVRAINRSTTGASGQRTLLLNEVRENVGREIYAKALEAAKKKG